MQQITFSIEMAQRAQIAYRTLTTLAAPFVAGALACSKRGRVKLGERFGYWGTLPESALWFHGASRGEVEGLLPIARELSDYVRVFSVTSSSGLDVAARGSETVRILPFDVPWCISNLLSRFRPQAFIFGETELWPALLEELYKIRSPICLVNARISDYTFDRYRFFKSLIGDALKKIDIICASSEQAAERFRALGADPMRVKVTGNCKHDKVQEVFSDRECRALQEQILPGMEEDSLIVTLGSIRPGEEAPWFEALLMADPRIKVVVVPRHLDKVGYFRAALERYRLTDRSALIDRFGMLEAIYAISNLAFIGATLVDIGGHNPLEAVRLGVPVALGPYTKNISDIVYSLDQNKAVFHVTNAESIKAVLDLLAYRPQELELIAKAALIVAAEHSGATARVMQELLRFIKR